MKNVIGSTKQHLHQIALVAMLASGLTAALPAQAVPAFARQTGEDCAACHTSFPELTPFGREFKLNGYTLGERQMIPLAMMMEFGVTHMDKQSTNAQPYMVRQNDPQFDGMSVFLASKISDYAGAFIQWTYENLDHFRNDGTVGHHSHADNTDIRIANHTDFLGKNLIFGLDLNNNPTVQDVWNSTPAWGFPFNGSKLAGLGNASGAVNAPSFGTQLDGGLAQTSAGLGGYFFWDRHLYGELTFYGTADKLFRPMSLGNWENTSNYSALAGRNNPYWRLAWNQDWGSNSLMVGTYGMRVDIYPDASNRTGSTDRFTDTALDAQYQYLSDPHIFTAQATYIHEKKDLNYSSVSNGTNPTDSLRSFKAKASYLYNRKYGATLAYFQTTGSADAVLYATNPSGNFKPDNRGYVCELDYNPMTNVRVALQYTGYLKIDGANNNYDGTGRKASDNNTLFLNTWFAF